MGSISQARFCQHKNALLYYGMFDSAGNYSPNIDSTFIYSKTGVIDKGGIIKMGEEVEQRIKR